MGNVKKRGVTLLIMSNMLTINGNGDPIMLLSFVTLLCLQQFCLIVL